MTPSLTRLSHITFHVKCGRQLASDLVNRFCFQPLAVRITEGAHQVAFKQGSAIFVVNETPRLHTTVSAQRGIPGICGPILGGESCKLFHILPKKQETVGSPVLDLLYDVSLSPAVDTVSNVSFEVEDVESLFRHLDGHGCRILIPPTKVEDDLGFVTYCVVKSLVGNICHTVIDRSQYAGKFLPGFQMIRSPATEAEGMVTHFDHITYACPHRSTPGVLEWYEKCFGFKRFQMSLDEEPEEGYIIQGGGVGLRLAALQYWKCSEVGLALSSGTEEPDCKFVIAESLPEQGRNQVDTFLEHHGGAGVQHIGLYTPDLLTASRALGDAGVQFVTPPPAYYSESSKEEEIRGAGQNPSLLSQLCVLLDAELKGSGAPTEQCEGRKRYLMQVFTKPIFSKETFFLELIQRRGASGFGEGNIRALWKAVQGYMDQQEGKS